MRRALALLLLSAATVLSSPGRRLEAEARSAPRRVDIANGVHLFISKPYGDVGLDGNSVAIVGRDAVLVFDTNGTPASAAQVLAEMRKLTDRPVRYVVYSHWHWDHWYGTEVYTAAFPGVKVIAHEKAKALMAGPAIEFNRPGIEQQLPGYIRTLEQRSAGDPAVRERIDDARFFLEQKKNARLVLPDTTYSDRMDIDLGGRAVQVLHHDRAITPGDSFLYLPAEHVVITGDLLVNPITFGLSSYPTGWLKTLEYIDGLDARVLVPGHGEPLHDKTRLHATANVLRALLTQGREAKARGLDADQAKEEILPRLRDLMVTLTNDDPALNDQFRTYLVDWTLHRVYDELDGPLSDAIAAIPPK
jgi:glyoxylase-like metal-dependent hydrolase (beta-lactamase superfamily II)